MDEFHDATAQLARTSYGSSRYLSLAESEFEDAASELEPGAWVQGGQRAAGMGGQVDGCHMLGC